MTNVALAGAGNVASHLAAAFAANGDIDLAFIGDRTPARAQALAENVGVAQWGALGDISTVGNLDLIVVSVADSGISDVAAAIGRHPDTPLTVHTSGTVSKSVLEAVSTHTGVLYPLQSFTAGVEANLGEVPFFIETACGNDFPLLESFARLMSPHVFRADERVRGSLHIAGVFANNFVNAMLARAEDILAAEGFTLDVVRPLVQATVAKAFAIGPDAAQTGPARRGDSGVIARQRERLPDNLRAVYDAVSNLITQKYHAGETDK